MKTAQQNYFAITLTKAEALRIQAEQIDWYAALYGARVRTLVAAATQAERLDDGQAYDVVEVNRCIPRGGAIEHLIRHLSAQAQEGE